MNGLSLIICFDNAEERHELWKAYLFAAIRQISELFNSNMNKYVAPSTDETPYPLHTRSGSISIIQRNCTVMDLSGNY